MQCARYSVYWSTPPLTSRASLTAKNGKHSFSWLCGQLRGSSGLGQLGSSLLSGGLTGVWLVWGCLAGWTCFYFTCSFNLQWAAYTGASEFQTAARESNCQSVSVFHPKVPWSKQVSWPIRVSVGGSSLRACMLWSAYFWHNIISDECHIKCWDLEKEMVLLVQGKQRLSPQHRTSELVPRLHGTLVSSRGQRWVQGLEKK
jgi:hypothetical protein